MRLLLILLISNFSLSQNSDQVFDSIIKYKQQRPSLALEYGFEYSKITFDRKPDLERAYPPNVPNVKDVHTTKKQTMKVLITLRKKPSSIHAPLYPAPVNGEP